MGIGTSLRVVPRPSHCHLGQPWPPSLQGCPGSVAQCTCVGWEVPRPSQASLVHPLCAAGWAIRSLGPRGSLGEDSPPGGIISFSISWGWTPLSSLWEFFVPFQTFYFVWGVEPVNNVMIVLGESRRDSPLCRHVSILPQTPLSSRLPHNIEQFPVLYSRSLLFICFKYSGLYMSIPNSL